MEWKVFQVENKREAFEDLPNTWCINCSSQSKISDFFWLLHPIFDVLSYIHATTFQDGVNIGLLWFIAMIRKLTKLVRCANDVENLRRNSAVNAFEINAKTKKPTMKVTTCFAILWLFFMVVHQHPLTSMSIHFQKKHILAASPSPPNHCRHFWCLIHSRTSGGHHFPLRPRYVLGQQRTSDFANLPQLEYWTSALGGRFSRGKYWTFWAQNFPTSCWSLFDWFV